MDLNCLSCVLLIHGGTRVRQVKRVKDVDRKFARSETAKQPLAEPYLFRDRLRLAQLSCCAPLVTLPNSICLLASDNEQGICHVYRM